jgi:hypothetical protein
MTTEEIDERINKLTKEANFLSASHDAATRRYQELATANINRFQQLRGAITELTWLKSQMNGAQKP